MFTSLIPAETVLPLLYINSKIYPVSVSYVILPTTGIYVKPDYSSTEGSLTSCYLDNGSCDYNIDKKVQVTDNTEKKLATIHEMTLQTPSRHY